MQQQSVSLVGMGEMTCRGKRTSMTTAGILLTHYEEKSALHPILSILFANFALYNGD